MESLDGSLENFDQEFEEARRRNKRTTIIAAVGAFLGVIGGGYLGEYINDYISIVEQTPTAIRYAIDIGFGVVGAGVGAGVFGLISKIPTLYRYSKRI